ncbi:MAG: enoyl-CoA hydratase/isomerase family protein [Candidatus Eisenbacteria bacterium]|uniref:Enoyl-CoA hydratase/isomerase family protein n=1 Tax=Eiseniibacteriota bacterium TaxID=2212470 RepID=A0A538T6G0_UNCEI|nr:MAG: enoyl-CoA hydratase/isomerase family protein [Candidatus Eisenbacteria bacterium]
MTQFSRLKLEIKPSAARLTLARPEVRNAFDDVLIAELTRALEELRASYEAAPERSPRALVLAGEGAVFCAGADMNWMRRSVAYTQSENEADARRMAAMYRTLDELPIPTIARVHGTSLGGGMGLLACCDMAVAVDTAQFGFTEARLGIAPAVISPFVLPKIGGSAARRYFLTAEIFGAVQAKEIGLVHEIVPAGELDQAVDRLVAALAENGPRAVSAAKRLIREALARNRDDALENAIRAIAGLRASPEGQEGLGAFLEKRPPSWKL